MTSEELLKQLESQGLNKKLFNVTKKNPYSLVLILKEKLLDKEAQLNHLSYTFNISGLSDNPNIEFNTRYKGNKHVLINPTPIAQFPFETTLKHIAGHSELMNTQIKEYNKKVKELRKLSEKTDVTFNAFIDSI